MFLYIKIKIIIMKTSCKVVFSTTSFITGSCLKGQCRTIFDLCFFHQTIPSVPLIHRLKLFDKVGALAVFMTPLRPTLRIQLCKLDSQLYPLSRVIDTADAGDLDAFQGNIDKKIT
jgi:hypothetical protein